MRPTQIQIQKLVLAPLMQQSAAILMLPQAEILMAIDQELQNNPLLEIEYDPRDSNQLSADNLEELSYLSRTGASEGHGDDEEHPEPLPIARAETLQEHLLNQLRIEISNPLGIAIGEFIIGNIDDDGFLKVSLEEIIAAVAGADMAMVKETLAVIQNFDPTGVACHDIQECLAIQLNACDSPLKHLAVLIVSDYFDCLACKKFLKIAKKLGISEDTARQAAELISSLEPKPARRFNPANSTVYICPDVSITKADDGQYKVEICSQTFPRLKINHTYQNLLNRPNLQESEKDFIKEKMANALNFIKSLQLRSSTIVEITQHILNHQKDFFELDDACLNPLKLKDVAQAIGRSESTVSRAINNKYVDTPRGIFSMKYFFCQAIACGPDETVSSHAVKEEIQRMIEEEDKARPLSDQDIQNRLKNKGFNLARRTLTKHRQSLKIPPSHQRYE
ncbi:MAG: RNA polymerase factor sigma-54 [Candidatus Omnitrophica bacterium]|nr:RNA polymerase factor sigma-54 [Candidatus Omnitrophota bacterium]MDE2214397.1 RNA polymerase factor sigma-54 [Candidatus Omnitrophota bacterium]MDE2231537.1 RNA polymerase factor sigma-54 [Candidatus Omnitrophota bacterium]